MITRHSTLIMPIRRSLLVFGVSERLFALQHPSGAVFFQSMARSSGYRSIGVLLPGMGEDGAEGLSGLRHADGFTIAEHESTAVVYGMPAVGAKVGAVCETLPITAIAPRLLQLTSGMKGAC